MSESNGEPNASITPLPVAMSASPRGHVLAAWLLIIVIGGTIIYLQNFVGRRGAAERREAVNFIMLEFQARLFVAIPQLAKAGGNADPQAEKKALESLVSQIEQLNRGSVDERLCALIALGELAGPERTLVGIDGLVAEAESAKYVLTPSEGIRIDILKRFYTDYSDKRPNAPTVSPDERKLLVDAYGWFGELALSPADPDGPPNAKRDAVLAEASQALSGAVFILMIAIAAFAVGAIGLFMFAVLALMGRWKSKLGPAVAHHGVYAETFALWFGLYFVLIGISGISAARTLPPWLQLSLPMILSLAALVWPVWRGIAWKQVRQDIGLTWGQQPMLEPIYGIVSYMNSLPLVVVGLGIVLTMQAFLPKSGGTANAFDPSPNMAHPLIQQLRNAKLEDLVPYFLLMSVFAPIMEEIMFRGVLYRHLRDGTRGWPFGVVFSILVVNIVFAAAHPQGLLAIPLLASLACGFVLAREWRGTLIPAIIAHGLNNALILACVSLCVMK